MTKTPDPRDEYLQTPDGRLFLRLWPMPGDRAPILLMHDSLGSVELWRSFPAHLALRTGRSVIAYDRLGFGRSDPRDALPGPDFVAEEARGAVPLICRHLGLTHFIACGHSVGGGMAVEIAAQEPERCIALITIAAQAVNEPKTKAGVQEAKDTFSDPEALGRLHRYHGEKSRWVVDAWTENWLSEAFADWTLTQTIARVPCPTLALHGELDEYGSVENAARIARAPQGRMKILTGVGHVPHRDNEALLLDEVAAFLGLLPDAGGQP
ncbi:alpha/beta fold hydrolase [Paracoccus sulfuroxidans]|uniref:Pimeloyl-ACP methyl ester carboxylesterase n=1 Tax=Paracoccus sulfuroxidans TaxID=384678 RepID=A0A562NSQ1_9RHOB|nr:alpha/beta fold hydrolase [Paracoccus sulfuroxidans]TWI35185.1 pimeloyl-ACP methyl ester carboxylesterase [Paracoccus sulfuroxidans]